MEAADEIGAVLDRASELRAKINNCIDRASSRQHIVPYPSSSSNHSFDHPPGDGGGAGDDEVGDEEEESDSLIDIRDALESLEEQLASLQSLQQQQRYEREATLAEINHSRKFLLKKLKEYKGEDLEVIHEASAFAGGTVEDEEDLLLPPYLNRLPDSLILDNTYSSHFSKKSLQNGANGELRPKIVNESEKPSNSVKPSTGIGYVLGFGMKTLFTLVSVIAVLNLSGFELKVGKKSNQFKVLHLFQKPDVEKQVGIQCPPGKISVIEDGHWRCVVKERVEVPFEPVVPTPDVNYGCG